MDSYITYLTAEDVQEKKRGFPFEIEIPIERDGVSSLRTIEMKYQPGDPIFRFYIKDFPAQDVTTQVATARDAEKTSPDASVSEPVVSKSPGFDLVNSLLVNIATTLEAHKPHLPAYISSLPYLSNPEPSLGASTTFTTIDNPKLSKKKPDSFLKVMRIVDGWLICGGGSSSVYRSALFAALDNAKSEGLLLPPSNF